MPTFFGTAAPAALKLGTQTVASGYLGTNIVYEERLSSNKILNWTVGQKPNVAWYGVVFGDGQFVGMGLEPFYGGMNEANLKTKLYTSFDGITWTLRYTFNKRITTGYSLAYGMMAGSGAAPVFAVIGDQYAYSSATLVLAYSYDGITWIETNFSANGCSIANWGSASHIPYKLVSRHRPSSVNQPTWPGELFAVPPANATNTPIAQAFGGSLIGMCENTFYDPATQTVTPFYPAWGTLISTPDGWLVQDHDGQWYFAATNMDWRKTTAAPTGMSFNTLLHRVGNNKTVAVETGTLSTSRVLATTTNGNTWEWGQNAVQLATTVTGLAFGGGLFVAVGNKTGVSSNIFCSRDGNTWASQTTSAASVKHNAIAYGNDRFVMLGDSTYVALWDGTKIDTVLTTPAAPTSLSATFGDAQVILSWAAPTNTGGYSITNYVVQYSSNNGSTWTTFNDGVSTTTSAVVTGLTNGVSYLFRVAAVNSQGTGPYALTASGTPVVPVITFTSQPQNDTADLDACYGPTAPNNPVPYSSEHAALFSAISTVSIGSQTFQWQTSSDNGVSWTNISNGRLYQTTTDAYWAGGISAALWIYSYATPTGMANLSNGALYRVVATSTLDPSVSVASNAVTLTVPVPTMTITQHPTNYSTNIGSAAAFSVQATKNFVGFGGQNGFSYQWQRSNDNGVTWTDWMEGPTYSQPTLQLSGLTYADNWSKWRCLVYSYIFCGGEQVQVLAYSNAATLTTPGLPPPDPGFVLVTQTSSDVAGIYTYAGTYQDKPYYVRSPATQSQGGVFAYLYWADSQPAVDAGILLSDAWYIGKNLGALPTYTPDAQIHFWTNQFATTAATPPEQPPASVWSSLSSGPEPSGNLVSLTVP
jgi:hypothetical protein